MGEHLPRLWGGLGAGVLPRRLSWESRASLLAWACSHVKGKVSSVGPTISQSPV